MRTLQLCRIPNAQRRLFLVSAFCVFRSPSRERKTEQEYREKCIDPHNNSCLEQMRSKTSSNLYRFCLRINVPIKLPLILGDDFNINITSNDPMSLVNWFHEKFNIGRDNNPDEISISETTKRYWIKSISLRCGLL